MGIKLEKLENIDLTGFQLHGHALPLSELLPNIESLAMAVSSGEVQEIVIASGSRVPQLKPSDCDQDLYNNSYVTLIKKS